MMAGQTVTSNQPAPSHRRGRTLNDLRTSPDGPPLSLSELSHIVGFSTQKLRADIDGGYLMATRALYGQRPPYRVTVGEARTYLHALGLL